MDDNFKEKGKIVKKISEGEYEVRLNTGKIIRRHAIQLRRLEGGDVVSERIL